VILAATTAAAIRLIPLGWLHPLNYDEIEFFRATDWVRQGLIPHRDFWEHHTPLQWIVFAPFAALSRGSGVDAVIWMRWVQVPLWIAIFWMANRWMRRLALGRFARWSAMAIALTSSFLMIAAVEYRIDTPGCALYLAGMLLFLRSGERLWWASASGAVFVLTILANLRLAPLVAVTMILLSVVDPEAKKWHVHRRSGPLFGGAIAMVALAGAILAATGALDELIRYVWVENYVADRFTEEAPRVFVHRLLVTLGLLYRGTRLTFEPTAIDPGGVALLVLGGAGLVLALRSWRAPDQRLLVALAQLASLIFIARMKRVYNYHFEIVAMMMLPLVATAIERVRRRELVVAAIVTAAWCVNFNSSVLRGKELDLAYQDRIMREVDARTLPGEKVWDGVGFALRRRPAYHFWFLPDLAVTLVRHGYAEPYRLAEIAGDPPAAVIADFNVLSWLGHDRVLRRFVVTHYLPVWRNLWVPAPNARLTAERPGMTWIVPREGDYRLIASRELADHPWFRVPVWVSLLDRPDAAQFPLTLPAPAAHPGLEWTLDGKAIELANGRIRLRKGQRIAVRLKEAGPLGVMLVPGSDTRIFRQPPPEVTLEAAYPRHEHLPRLGARID
jgi:hypothetical protein